MRLYVDDIRRCPDGWQLARTVTEAIRILATQDVTEVSLDHDICHEKAVDDLGTRITFSCDETYEAVAWYIAALNKLREIEMAGYEDSEPIKVKFHTANPAGEKRMREILGL